MLYTAPDGAVLAGTTRQLVLEVCAREGIPVALTPPDLADVSRWQGAFISSTSRLVLPVHELAFAPHASAAASSAAEAPSVGSSNASNVAIPSDRQAPQATDFVVSSGTSRGSEASPNGDADAPAAPASTTPSPAPDGLVRVSIPSSACDIVTRIEAMVAKEVESHSTPLLLD